MLILKTSRAPISTPLVLYFYETLYFYEASQTHTTRTFISMSMSGHLTTLTKVKLPYDVNCEYFTTSLSICCRCRMFNELATSIAQKEKKLYSHSEKTSVDSFIINLWNPTHLTTQTCDFFFEKNVWGIRQIIFNWNYNPITFMTSHIFDQPTINFQAYGAKFFLAFVINNVCLSHWFCEKLHARTRNRSNKMKMEFHKVWLKKRMTFQHSLHCLINYITVIIIGSLK